jgi:riboflavin kinase
MPPEALFPALSGTVVHGDKRGRVLGFPTANIAVEPGTGLPPDGVYSCYVSLAEEATRHGATCSIGLNPTFDGVESVRVEVYIHDFAADLYGQRITLTLVNRIRDMRKFETVDELIAQTYADVQRSKGLLAE